MTTPKTAPLSQTPDGTLLTRYLRRSGPEAEAAFAEIGRRYAALVYGACLRELHNPGLAEDAAQEVFLLLARKAPELTGASSVAGWLFTSARLVASNIRRQETRWQTHQTQASEEATRQMQTMQQEKSPRTTVAWDELEPHLNQAVAALSPADRDALLIRHFDGASLAETGARLGIAPNAARMRVNRALERVRRDLHRAGIVLPAAVLAALLDANHAPAAPPSLTSAIAQIAASAPPVPITSSDALTTLSQKGTLMSLTATSAVKITAATATASLVLLLGWGGLRAMRPAPPTTGSNRATASLVRRDALSTLVGKWTGELEYRDYQTNRRVTLGTVWTITPVPDSPMVFNATHQYGGERTDRFTMTFSPQPAFVETESDGTRSTSAVSRGNAGLKAFTSGQQPLILTRTGTDDNQPAEIRQTVTLSGDKLTWLKEVRPKGQTVWAFRNRYTLTRTR